MNNTSITYDTKPVKIPFGITATDLFVSGVASSWSQRQTMVDPAMEGVDPDFSEFTIEDVYYEWPMMEKLIGPCLMENMRGQIWFQKWADKLARPYIEQELPNWEFEIEWD